MDGGSKHFAGINVRGGESMMCDGNVKEPPPRVPALVP